MANTDLESALNDIPQLPAHNIAWVFKLEAPSLGNNLFSCKRSPGIPPSRVRPPFFHSVDVRLVKLVLLVY